jgi:hypothetical protein
VPLAISQQQRKIFPRAIAGSLFFTAFLCAHAAYAQESSFVLPPAPKAELLEKVHHSRFALDRTAITFGLVQGGAELFDGFTTRYFVHHCSSCVEVDPASRLLLGARPNWTGMLEFGSLEAVATTYAHQTMRSSSHKFIRRIAAITPISIIGVHLIAGAVNLSILRSPEASTCSAPPGVASSDQCPSPSSVITAPPSPIHPRHSGQT